MPEPLNVEVMLVTFAGINIEVIDVQAWNACSLIVCTPLPSITKDRSGLSKNM